MFDNGSFLRRRKRFKRSDEEKRVLSAYFGGDPAAIDAADGLFRQQQQPHYPGLYQTNHGYYHAGQPFYTPHPDLQMTTFEHADQSEFEWQQQNVASIPAGHPALDSSSAAPILPPPISHPPQSHSGTMLPGIGGHLLFDPMMEQQFVQLQQNSGLNQSDENPLISGTIVKSEFPASTSNSASSIDDFRFQQVPLFGHQ